MSKTMNIIFMHDFFFMSLSVWILIPSIIILTMRDHRKLDLVLKLVTRAKNELELVNSSIIQEQRSNKNIRTFKIKEKNRIV